MLVRKSNKVIVILMLIVAMACVFFFKQTNNEEQTINQLYLASVNNSSEDIITLLKQDPEVLKQIENEIERLSILQLDSPMSDFEKSEKLFVIYLELVKLKEVIGFDFKSHDKERLDSVLNLNTTSISETVIGHSSNVNTMNVEQQKFLSAAIQILALNNEFKINDLVERYKQENSKKMPVNIFSQGILKATILQTLQYEEMLPFSTEAAYHEASLFLKNVKTVPDLARSLNQSDNDLAPIAARLIGDYLPEQGIHSLYSKLARSESKESSLVILNSIEKYGAQARSGNDSLKRLMLVTKDIDLRNKIESTIKVINGRK